MAEVCFGSDVIIKEHFMVASGRGPIMCLGRWLRSGWGFTLVNGELHLCKDVCAKMVTVLQLTIERTVFILKV